MAEIRTDWTIPEIEEIYHSPLLELMYRAATVHRGHHATGEVQVCTLLSIKTGGCPEDCSYCPQSARYQTEVDAEAMLDSDVILNAARTAKDAGSTRFCMGAAWRNARKTKILTVSSIWFAKSPIWIWKSAARWACLPTSRQPN
jgi:biotin synthase